MAGKKIYKIYNIETQKYFGTGKKNSWATKTGVEGAVENMCSQTRYSYRATTTHEKQAMIEKMKQHEIHEFELVLTNSYNAGAKLMDVRAIKTQIAELEKEINYRKEWLTTVLKLNLSISSILDFYDKGVFNEEIRNQIKPVKENIDANTTKVNELKNLIKNL